MYIKCLTALLLVFSFLCGLGSGSYCNLSECGRNNLGCDNDGKFNPKCLPDTRIVPMKIHRKSLLSAFNKFRNSVASGQKKLRPAARMSSISWSMELEYMAKLTLLSCSMENYCLSTKNFCYVGSILDALKYAGKMDPDEIPDYIIITKLINGWMDRLADISLGMVISMPDKLGDIKIANAALLISEANTHVGCMGMRFTLSYFHHFVLVCAFSTDVFINRSLYKLTARPGSACKRRDSTYPALCAPGEIYHNDRHIPNGTLLRPYGKAKMQDPDQETFNSYNFYNYGRTLNLKFNL
ncbi:allergen Tab y 5.0101-like [Drosophila pseudoobscura]|uniref:Allergen Tab y 5.0101-like n=1 Tax=Drosophila pseudoobscura pseudoobscura TaxID=46245 RepID=A0A6I8V3X7_DROPS|nr:allergen Tab y 5.0101 [Drosophila pseudoobscura]